ncbi:ATP-grasp domain-containing protein [Actinophytocola glycyrrhizae]|uniref:ATP-grasp domain-containing protein n=1 Tax=Actinophytocola glycyrrhizae TaxID=2044873 RepID=A0ABV9RYU3_9PSEU
MSTLVVLGAADGSLSTYRTAGALGYRTICVDRSPTAPGVRLADEFLPLSTRDTDAIAAALAGRDDLAGALAPSTDIALPTLLALTERLGLPVTMTREAAGASLDKRHFRRVCEELGFPVYRWRAVTGATDWEWRGPAVVKPADAQSGRGVTRCADESMLATAVATARGLSYGGGVVVEDEVTGTHCGCECVLSDGEVAFLALTERTLSPPPRAVTTAHLMPADVPARTRSAVVTMVERLCARLRYRTGPLNLDLVVARDGEPYLIEMGARTSGNGLDELVRHCHGVDTIAASVAAAVRAPVTVTPHAPRPTLWQALSSDRAGRLTAVHGLPSALAMPEVVAVRLFAEPGDEVRAHDNVANKLGYAVLTAPTTAGLRTAAERLARTLVFEVAPMASPA